MKIAYVVRQLDSTGGRERVCTNKANYFAHMGSQVHVVTMFQTVDRVAFHLDHRVAVHRLNLVRPENFRGGQFRYSLYVKRALEKVLSDISPDIAVSMWWGIEFKLLPFIRDGSYKVLEFHFSQYMRDRTGRMLTGSRSSRIRWRITRWIDDLIVGMYDQFVVLTQEDRQCWHRKCIRVIPNALSFVSAVQSDCSEPTLIAIGRLTEQKGFDRLIDIWALVEDESPEWWLRIYGDGPERDALLRMIESKHLKRVSLLPATTDIPAVLLQSSIFVFTSRYEGFGLAITEAMQCGLPVVSYDTKCGPSEIIEHGVTGYIVEEGNAESFAEKLRCLMANRELRIQMGKAGARRSSEMFDERIVMEQWRSLFEELITRAR